MHIKTKRIILVLNSTLLQASTKLADWRSVIPYLLGLKSSVAQLPSCLCVVPPQRHGLSRYLQAASGARISYRLRPSKSAAG